VLPIAHATGNFELRTRANVFRIEHDGRRASGVRYHDAEGREVRQQAGIVIVAAYTLNNVRLLLLSGLGEPYDPRAQTGTVGRNYSYQLRVDALGFFGEKTFRRYMGMTTAGYSVDDWNGDNFDHSGLGFIGGGDLGVASSFGMPIGFQPVPPGTPAWGSGWKAAIRKWYDRTLSISAMGEVLSYRDHFLDLDPTYRDAWGTPLLRISFDWRENERRLSGYLAGKIDDVARAMGADQVAHAKLDPKYDTARYQSTHNTGGAVMGSDPQTSVVNSYLQSWDVDNVFVVGASAFPQNPGYTPTPTVAALAYRAAEGIVERYVKAPGPLA
jgi:gluconate 2-dehydrogenase alpha chain